jgi:hypothetical protein
MRKTARTRSLKIRISLVVAAAAAIAAGAMAQATTTTTAHTGHATPVAEAPTSLPQDDPGTTFPWD